MHCLSKANAQLKFFERNVFTSYLDWVAPTSPNRVCCLMKTRHWDASFFVVSKVSSFVSVFLMTYVPFCSVIETFFFLKIILLKSLAIFCSNSFEATYHSIVTKLRLVKCRGAETLM